MDEEEEEIDAHLSPTASFYGSLSSGSSRPTTPDDDTCERWSMSSSPRSFHINDTAFLYPRLERSVSQISCDSKETIRPGKEVLDVNEEMDGEVTPKADKSWKVSL
jgi:hypothetical protein